MVHTQRYRYQSPHLNAEKTHFQSIEMKHNTLLCDAILPPPARPRTAVLGCIIEGRTAITTPPKPF